MKPYYADDAVTIYHGDCREILLGFRDRPDLVLTDPPYPNNAGHFTEHVASVRVALALCSWVPRHMVFWHQLEMPPIHGRTLVARHIWHRTNTNRPDNYEAIYEFADEAERPSKVFAFPVVYPGLTGCVEATGHPTQKPLKLMQSLITLRGASFVLDPFAGSGSTIEAAKRLGCRAIGIELDERYCEIAARRCAQDVLDFEEAV